MHRVWNCRWVDFSIRFDRYGGYDDVIHVDDEKDWDEDEDYDHCFNEDD